ncbi:MAG TPA: multiheme c-type cytochrome [Gemmataceae bacterium]|jgi:hypothetical protein|nr:multiheme c-type cytochrome [Gemmataceae bacterium]
MRRFLLLFVPALLAGMLAGLIRYEILSPRAIRPSSAALTGRVVSESGPAEGAQVRFQGDSKRVYTNANGEFTLAVSRPSTHITAWKEGYFIAGAPNAAQPLELRLRKLPDADHEEYSWIDPTPNAEQAHNCGNCHAQIYDEWKSSGHARSASNRRFRNLYEGTNWHGRPNVGWNLLKEHPDGAGVCAACHAPTAKPSAELGYDMRQMVKADSGLSGVHCDYCHKIAGPDEGEVGLTHGRYGLKLLRPAKGQLFLGPLDDVDRDEDTFSPFQRESRYCASCHEGTVFGVPVYTTYTEWLASPARQSGQQCQHCHMAPTGQLTNIAPGHGGIDRDPATLGNHRFFAGSQLDMLRRCLHLKVELRAEGDQQRATVSIETEGVGHRVPTGFIDRHLVLVVIARDDTGKEVPPVEGPRLPELAGEVRGQPGRLYAKILKDFAGHSPVPFWRADTRPEDSRLLPGQTETSTWLFPASTRKVEARLLYRKFWTEVAAAKGWPENEMEVAKTAMERNGVR